MNTFECSGKYQPDYIHEGHIAIDLSGKIEIPLTPDNIIDWCRTCQNKKTLHDIIDTCRTQIRVLDTDVDDFRSRA